MISSSASCKLAAAATLVCCFCSESSLIINGFILPSSYAGRYQSKTQSTINKFYNRISNTRPAQPFSTTTTTTTKTRSYYASSVFDTNNDDPFVILNINPSQRLNKQALRIAYKVMAKKYHPDVITDGSSSPIEKKLANDYFAKINWAYEVLMLSCAETSFYSSSSEYYYTSSKHKRSTWSSERSDWWAPSYEEEADEINTKEYQSVRRQRRADGASYTDWTNMPGYGERAEQNTEFQAAQKQRRTEEESRVAEDRIKEEHEAHLAEQREAAKRRAEREKEQEVRHTQSAGTGTVDYWWNSAGQGNTDFDEARRRRRTKKEDQIASRRRKADEAAFFATEEEWEITKKRARVAAEEMAQRIAEEQKAAALMAEKEARVAAELEEAQRRKEAAEIKKKAQEVEAHRVAAEHAAKKQAKKDEASRLAAEQDAGIAAKKEVEEAVRVKAKEEARVANEATRVFFCNTEAGEEELMRREEQATRLKAEINAHIVAEQQKENPFRTSQSSSSERQSHNFGGGVLNDDNDILDDDCKSHKHARKNCSGKTVPGPQHYYYSQSANVDDKAITSEHTYSQPPSPESLVNWEEYIQNLHFKDDTSRQHVSYSHYCSSSENTEGSSVVHEMVDSVDYWNKVEANQRLKEEVLSILWDNLHNAKSFLEKKEIKEKIDALNRVDSFKRFFTN